MISSLPQRKVWLIVPLLLLLALLACDLFGAGPAEGKPTIAIVSPPSGTQVEVGQQLNVQSAATDSQGVVRVELWVDGALYRSDASPSPQGQTSFSLVQPWTASTIGSHTLLVKAYNVAGTASDPAIIVVNVVEAVAVGTPTLTPPPGATFTPTPTVTNTPVGPTPAACTPNATFVTDVTIPDGTVVSPGQQINKVWRMQNSGNCPWDSSYLWVFVSGTQMGGSSPIAVPNTAPGTTADISVTMFAPSTPGTYTGYWQMKSPTGQFFGNKVRIMIVVPSPATPTATPIPTATPTQPPPPPVIEFTVDDDSITAGDCTTLRVHIENVQAAYLSGAEYANSPVTGPLWSGPTCPASTTTYTLHVIKLDASTEDKTVTINVTPAGPTVAYDFLENASSAHWWSGPVPLIDLTYPGSGGDAEGFVRPVGGWTLEDGSTAPTKSLETHPKWVDNGWISGRFPTYTVQPGDHFKAKVGFLKNAFAGDVTFKVAPFGEPPLYSGVKSYDGSLMSIDIDLSGLVGHTVDFILNVDAHGSSGQDWAVWVEPRIEH